MLCIFSCFYFLHQILIQKKIKEYKVIIKFIGISLLAGLSSLMIWLPTVSQLIGGDRYIHSEQFNLEYIMSRLFIININQASNIKQQYWNLNIYQYTDISLNINNHVNSDKLTSKNLVKKLYIDNVNFSTKPTLGNPNLFYKNPNSLGIGIVNDLDNKIEDKMDFSVISKNEDVDYKIPSFYADCSNPITLSYVNSNVYSSFILENNSGGITFDGTLLKKSNTLLSNIRVTVDFTIHLINANDEEYICNVSLPINLSDDNSTIYNGHYAKQLTDLDNYKFVKQNQ